MSDLTVACLCGSLQLRVSAAPLAGFYCHCADCRAAHGAAYVGVALYPSAAVEVIAGTAASFTLRRERLTNSRIGLLSSSCNGENCVANKRHAICAQR